MAVFKQAPIPPDTRSPMDKAAEWLAAQGLETGVIGAVLLGLGALLLLFGAVQVVRVIRARIVERLTDGEVIGVEPASNGGYHPILRYRDATGRVRRFVASAVIPADATGQRMLLRIDGPRPLVAPRPPSPLSEALGMVLPLVLGYAATTAGLTGRVAGVLPLPFL